MRVAIVFVGIASTIFALTINSIYGLWYLCADLVYVILFPQLLCVIYMPFCNTYGSLAGYAGAKEGLIEPAFMLFSSVGLILRLSGGEPLVSLPPSIHYPMYDEDSGTQYFPFRTLAMICSLTTIIIVWKLFFKQIYPYYPYRYQYNPKCYSTPVNFQLSGTSWAA